MKIARVETTAGARTALVEDDVVRLLSETVTTLDVLADPNRVEPSGESRPLESIRLLPPLEPPSIRDFLTFEAHVEGMARLHDPPRDIPPQWYEAPTFYFTNPHSLIGAHDDVAIPPGCRMFDFELEVAAIVGRHGRDLASEDATGHIAGYAILNDWSARDLQFAEMQVGLGPAKGKDSAITLGPWIVTADELVPYQRDGRLDLRMEAAVNGEQVGGDTLASMAWSFEDLAAYASRGTWIRTGDVLGSGTCGGGCLGELWGRKGVHDPPPLTVGDTVRLTVEALGSIENRVVAAVAPVPVPKARSRPRRRPWSD